MTPIGSSRVQRVNGIEFRSITDNKIKFVQNMLILSSPVSVVKFSGKFEPGAQNVRKGELWRIRNSKDFNQNMIMNRLRIMVWLLKLKHAYTREGYINYRYFFGGFRR